MKNLKYYLIFFFFFLITLACKKGSEFSLETNEFSISKRLRSGIMASINESNFASVINTSDYINLIDPNAIDNQQPAPYFAAYNDDSSSLQIFGKGELSSQDTMQYAQIQLQMNGFRGVDTYPFKLDGTSSNAVISIVDIDGGLRHFFTKGTTDGYIKINYFDSSTNLISGAFEFSAISNDSVLVVKNGIFNALKIN